MALIILAREDDPALDNVISWLTYTYKVKVFRINQDSDLKLSSYNIFEYRNVVLTNKYDKSIVIKDISTIWIHGCYYIKKSVYANGMTLPVKFQVEKNISADYNSVFFPLVQRISEDKQSRLVGDLVLDQNAKMRHLYCAYSVGLLVPESYIVTDKKSLKNILLSGKKFITKSFDNSFVIDTERIHISGHRTESIGFQDIDLLGDEFHPSFIQENISKKYELRIFFFQGTFFSMAIFSQLNASTSIDSRKDFDGNQCRYVPYALSCDTELKLVELFKKLQLTTGVIDMIVTNDDNYVFLEINPIGQYVFTSAICNYFIEDHIAKYLLNETH